MPALHKNPEVLRKRSVVGDADFGEDGGVSGGSGAFLGGDPGSHAIGGGVHGGEGRAAESVVNESGGEGVAGADGVGDFYGEAGVFILRGGSDEQTAVGSASDADDLYAEFTAEPASGRNVRAL